MRPTNAFLRGFRRLTVLLAVAGLLGSALGLGGCAAMDRQYQERLERRKQEDEQHQALLRKNLQDWVGHPASELVADWTPTESTSLPDHSMVLEYDYVGRQLLGPTQQSKLQFQSAEATGESWCTVRFVVGADGRVKSSTWRENSSGCPTQ